MNLYKTYRIDMLQEETFDIEIVKARLILNEEFLVYHT